MGVRIEWITFFSGLCGLHGSKYFLRGSTFYVGHNFYVGCVDQNFCVDQFFLSRSNFSG